MNLDDIKNRIDEHFLGSAIKIIHGVPIYVKYECVGGPEIPTGFVVNPIHLASITVDIALEIAYWCKEHTLDLYIQEAYILAGGFNDPTDPYYGEWLDKSIVDRIKKSDFFEDDFKNAASYYLEKGVDLIRQEKYKRLREQHNLWKAEHPEAAERAAQEEYEKTLGYVYVMKSSAGLYKIGCTKNPDKRLTSFNKGLPMTFSYEKLIKTNERYYFEKRLHKKFSRKRVVGEWFSLNDADLALIKRIKSDVIF